MLKLVIFSLEMRNEDILFFESTTKFGYTNTNKKIIFSVWIYINLIYKRRKTEINYLRTVQFYALFSPIVNLNQ